MRTEGEESTLIWCEQALKLTEMREELRRIVEEEVLDMSFEEEVVRKLEKWQGRSLQYMKKAFTMTSGP